MSAIRGRWNRKELNLNYNEKPVATPDLFLIWFGNEYWANEITSPVRRWPLPILLIVKDGSGVQVNSCHFVCPPPSSISWHRHQTYDPVEWLNLWTATKNLDMSPNKSLGCLDLLYSATYSILFFFNKPIIIIKT